MNDKGQAGIVYIYGLCLGIVILLLALYLAPALSESIETTRNVSSGDFYGLDCTNSSISNFNKITCYATDLSLPYFIGFLILLALAIIGGKILIG